MSTIGNAAEAARQAAIEAARRAAAEAARKAAAEAARKQAAEAARKQAAESAKQAPLNDAAQVEPGAGRLEQAAEAGDKKSPWSLTEGLSQMIELGGDLGKTASRGLAAMVKAEERKTQAFVEQTAGRLSEEGQAALASLEKSGKLTAQDSQGGTVRDHMQRFLERGGDPAQAEAILRQIAQPDREIRQLGKETCVAATNMRDLAQQNPGEYFRMATELVQFGRTRFPDGQKLELGEANASHLEDRFHLPGDRVTAAMQTALMEFANGDHDYDLKSDTSSTRVDLGFVDFNFPTGRGVTIEEAKSLQEALGTAPTVDPRGLRDAGDDARMDHIARAIDDARQDGHAGIQIPVHLDDPTGQERFHMVEVRSAQDDQVTLWDVRSQKPYTLDREAFLDNVAWDITADDDIGGRRGLVAASGTGEFG